jgi:phenylpropionate dioxygenase-like ring-hydroxylating dioxygenase large terminal subunit
LLPHSPPSHSPAPPLEFASAPASWYFIGTVAELERGPVLFELPDGHRYVGFRSEGKTATVLNARCSHMGANLARGCVKDGRILCPLHGWEYGRDGRCDRIPSAGEIPSFARQQSFPVQEQAGLVFFFNRAEARFPLPFFNDVSPDELRPAEAFDLLDDVPWYLLAGNGFDRQHFESTHSRQIIGEPEVDAPHEFARRSRLNLSVLGDSWADRLTRMLAGSRSQMTVTSWCGSLIFATAKFRRTTTYGMVAVRPLANLETHAKVVVFVQRSKGSLGRAILDPPHARVRRKFIKAFFDDDVGRLSGTRFCRERMIDADKMLVEYLDWLHNIHR